MTVRRKVRDEQAAETKSHARRMPRYSLEEFARRGDAIYKEKIEPALSPKDKGKFVAIDIETGEYEIGRDSLKTTLRLYDRIPDAQPWMVRVGYAFVHRLGGHRRVVRS